MEVVLKLSQGLTAEDVASVLEHDSQTEASCITSLSLGDMEALAAFLGTWAGKEASELLRALSDACGQTEVVPFDALLCLLCSSMLHGPKDSTAWEAAVSYSTILVLPGSTAFGSLNPAVFRALMRLLRDWSENCVGAKKGAPAIRESKATKRPRRETARDAVDDDDEDDEDEDSAERSSAMPNTTKQMRALLEALPVVVSRVPLGSHRDLLGLLTEVFAAIINACAATPLESIATSSIGLAISTLVREEQHGPTHIKLALTFQAFLPLLLLSCKGGRGHGTLLRAHEQALNISLDLVHLLGTLTPTSACEDDGDDLDDDGKHSSKSTSEYHVVHSLLQYMCANAPDKADARSPMVVALCKIVQALPTNTERGRFLAVLSRFSRSSRAAYRAFSVDASSQLLEMAWVWDDASAEHSGRTVLSLVIARCCDRAPMVRVRSLAALTSVLNSAKAEAAYPPLRAAVHELVASGGSETTTNALLGMISQRVNDDKAAVRRAAVQALEVLMLLMLDDESPASTSSVASHIHLLEASCSDKSLSTRKQAMCSLSAVVVQCPSKQRFQDAWVQAVLPLASDPEQGVQSKLAELFQEMILDRVLEWYRCFRSHEDVSDAQLHAVWELLERAADPELQRCLQKVLAGMTQTSLAHYGHVLRALCAAAEEGAAASELDAAKEKLRCGAWILLEALFSSASAAHSGGNSMVALFKSLKLDAGFVVQSWESMVLLLGHGRPSASLEGDAIRILRVIAKVAVCIPAAKASSIAETLLEMLHAFQVQPAMAGAILQALKAVCCAKASSAEEGFRMCSQWINELLEQCTAPLQAFILPETDGAQLTEPAASTATLPCVLHLVGEIAMLGLSASEQGAFTIPVSRSLVSLVQALLPPTLPPTPSNPTSGEAVPESVRAHAFIALGKLCLLDQNLAKESINLLVRELVKADSVAVRSNALLVLSDLCVRYTALVDNHVPVMATCLQDPHTLVRRHALLLISQLLVQDYVKWRGLLLHRFFSALVDEDEGVSRLAEYSLCNLLLQKQPALFVSNFVDSLFVLNELREHAKYQAALKHGAKGSVTVTMDGINLGGNTDSQRAKRMRIYCLLLSNMSDEQRIQVTGALARDVLGAAADEGVEKYAPVLSDAFAILRCDEIRIVGGAAATNDGEGDQGDPEDSELGVGGTAQSLAAAKGKLLSRMSRKHVIEHVLPILISLKKALELAHSPLLRDLMNYFAHLYSTYGADVKAVLAADPTLAAEVTYDLRHQEKEKSRAKENTPGGAGKTPSKLPAKSPLSAKLKSKTPLSARRTPAQALSGFAEIRDAAAPMST